jgi:two-component system, NtrC family, response regulator AtoC
MQRTSTNGSRQLLFIDDERNLHDFITRRLADDGYKVLCAAHWREARDILSRGDLRPDVVFVEPLSAEADLAEISATCQPTPVVVLSVSRDPRKVVNAMKSGAHDYLCKPINFSELRRVVSDALTPEPAQRKPSRSPAARTGSPSGFVFLSPKMKQVHQTALQIAGARVPVLIQGESGVGKDVIAKIIHQESKLASKPFVKVNCAALPADLTESELFGYQKGAFTGANMDRPGKFEFANGGTIFLDEIGEFSPAVQAKLLQVLQDGRFTRLGSNEEVKVEVRIIAATNRRLDQAIEEGRFREDLYYRLNVVMVDVPPLRDRKEEIPVLSEHFVNKYRDEYRSAVEEIPSSLMEVFMAFQWPGNVRELENVVKRYLVLQDAESIKDELQGRMSQQMSSQIEALTASYLRDNPDSVDLKEISRKAALMVEKEMILTTLRKTSWNKWRAAKELKVSYKTLLTKIDQHEIMPTAY